MASENIFMFILFGYAVAMTLGLIFRQDRAPTVVVQQVADPDGTGGCGLMALFAILVILVWLIFGALLGG